MDRRVVGDLFLGFFDRIAILLQAFTEGSDFFAWVRPNHVEVAHVEGPLHLAHKDKTSKPGHRHYDRILYICPKRLDARDVTRQSSLTPDDRCQHTCRYRQELPMHMRT